MSYLYCVEDDADNGSCADSGTDSSEADSADGPRAFSIHPPVSSEEAERSPIVELWYELTEHLKDEDIPHPSEFRAEKVRIIRCDPFRPYRWAQAHVMAASY